MGRREAQRLGLIQAAIAGKVTSREGAEAVGLSVRQFKRLRARVRQEGPRAVVHGNRGRRSPRRVSRPVVEAVEALLTHAETRLNDCHIADLLAARAIPVSVASVRRIRLGLGVSAKRRRRPPQHRRRRLRAAHGGALVQVDGSPFAWWSDEAPPCWSVGAIDDATGQILALTFQPAEDVHAYATLLGRLFRQHGLPLKLYGDHTSVLVRNDDHWSLEEQLAGVQDPTQIGAALRELGIRYEAAHSPQAKGRIERLWGTLQDRLAAEMRLAHITTLAQAEAFLPDFIGRYNARFALAPREGATAFRPAPRELDRILCCRYSRTVARDDTVSIPGRWVQLEPGPHHRSWYRARVEVRELLDGRLLVRAASTAPPLPSGGASQPRASSPRRPRAPTSGATPRAAPCEGPHPGRLATETV